MGPTRLQGALEAPSAPWWVVGPTRGISIASQLYKYSNISETLGSQEIRVLTAASFRNPRESSVIVVARGMAYLSKSTPPPVDRLFSF